MDEAQPLHNRLHSTSQAEVPATLEVQSVSLPAGTASLSTMQSLVDAGSVRLQSVLPGGAPGLPRMRSLAKSLPSRRRQLALRCGFFVVLLLLGYLAGKHWHQGSSKGAAGESPRRRKWGPSDATAAAAAGLSTSHVRIFVPEIPKKYNYDLVQAALGLGATGSLYVAADQAAKSRQAQWDQVNELLANPFGAAIDGDPDNHEGMRLTTSTNLDFLMHMQLLQSPLRVHDISKADVVFVPLYLQKLLKIELEMEKPNKYALVLRDFWDQVPTMLPMLGQLPHFLVTPIPEAALMSTCGGWGIDFLCRPLGPNFTVLTPDVWTAPPDKAAASRIAPGLAGPADSIHPYAVAVPHLSHVHLSGGSLLAQRVFEEEAATHNKSVTAAEAFRARAPVRKLLQAQCEERPRDCVHYDASTTLADIPGGAVRNIADNNRRAWFCLQPPGDTFLGIGFYDCLFSGAVPVLFDQNAQPKLPFADVLRWEELVGVVDPRRLSQDNVLDILEVDYDKAHRGAIAAALHGVRAALQYSLSPDHLLVSFDSMGQQSPRDDALTMSLKALLRNLCCRGLLPHRC